MEIAIKQFGSTLILVFLIIGWMGLGMALSALAILIFRLIKIGGQ